MIKKDNLGNGNKLYLILHKADSLHLDNCKKRRKARSFYRLKNKEQEGEKWNIDDGYAHIANFVWSGNSQMPGLALAWHLGIGLLDTLHFWSSRTFPGTQKFYLAVCWHPGWHHGTLVYKSGSILVLGVMSKPCNHFQ